MNHLTYEPAYTPAQHARLDGLPASARLALAEIADILTQAEGVTQADVHAYLRLLDAVVEEASERRTYHLLTMG